MKTITAITWYNSLTIINVDTRDYTVLQDLKTIT